MAKVLSKCMIEKTQWWSVPFLQNGNLENAIPDPLESLWIERPKVVFERGNPGTWDEFGVRDPALLVDECGYLCLENVAMVLYYTGSHNKGFWQATGRAISYDEGLTWQRYPEDPVLSPKEGAWDSATTSTPWIIKGDDEIYRLYYRGCSIRLRDEAIGLALSNDGIHFEKVGSRPILTADDFDDIPSDGYMFMGVINVVHILDGRFLLTFEGCSASFGLTSQIFGAVSEDGEHFQPLNSGYPIFTANHVRSWPVKRVANPRITVLEDHGLYMLAFNGCYNSGLYSIGLAFSKDLKEWWEHPRNPVLSPSGTPLDDPFSGRIEGGVLIKEDIKEGKNPIRMFFMGIPRGTVSHGKGVIGLAQGRAGEIGSKYPFRFVSTTASEVVVLHDKDKRQDTLCLQQDADSAFPPRVHFTTLEYGDFRKVYLEFFLDPAGKGSAFIVFDEDAEGAILVQSIQLGFSRERLYLWSGWHRKSFRGLLHNWRVERLLKWLTWRGWNRIGNCKKGVWKTLAIEESNSKWTVQLDGHHIASIPKARLGKWQINDISIKSCHQPINIRKLKVLVDD